MSETPFMPLWVSDFIGDTLELDAKQIGAYMLLLMAMWQHGGTLPADPKKLQRVARIGRDWPKVWADLERFFKVENGEIICPAFSSWQNRSRLQKGRPSIPLQVQKSVWERDGECCAYCGSINGPFHLDHIHPWSLGGEHSIENLTVACVSCNLSKGNKTLAQWKGLS